MNVLDILNSPWAIQPESLSEMCAIYASHRNGEISDFKMIGAAFGSSNANRPKPYTVQDGVALIPVEGILAKRMGLFAQICGGMSYTSLQEDLAQALADPEVNSMILNIDSPGGAVDGCQAAGDAIFAARSQKPICAYVDGKATSAAYWLGSAASQIYIGSDTDQVGSIGVIAQHLDTSNAEHQRGIKVTDLAAGRYKAVGSQHAPLSAQDRSTIQDHLDQLYSIFVDTVARNRGSDPESVHTKMADGRVFVGQKAIDAGLVDGKITLSALVQKMSGGNSLATNYPNSRPRPVQTARPNRYAQDASAPVESPSAPVATTATPTPVAESTKPTIAPTADQLKIEKLLGLKQEELRLKASVPGAREAVNATTRAQTIAIRAHEPQNTLAEVIGARIKAENNLRSIFAAIRENDSEQLMVLRG